MDKKILLLGATGLLGNNVLRQLLDRGYEVRALVRSEKGIVARKEADGERIEVAIGKITRYEDLRLAAEGCGGIINCAGVTDMGLLKQEEYYAVNRDLVRELLRVMDECGIEKMVHISTANTIGYGAEGKKADESAEMEAPFDRSLYALSKREGERIALGDEKKRAVVLNPGFMVGGYDVRPSSGKMLMMSYGKRLMMVPKGGKSFICAEAAASAAVSALERGIGGERYLLTGENLTLKEFYRRQAEVCGYRQRIMELPNWLVRTAGVLGDGVRLLGIRSELSTRNVRQLLIREYYDNGKAVGQLGMPDTNIDEGIRRFFESNRTKEHK